MMGDEILESEELAAFEAMEAKYEEEQRLQTSHENIMSRQVGGTHYKKIPAHMQPWSIIDMYGLNFYEGCALKYLLRKKTNRIEDLEKLNHYIEKEISNLKFSEIK